MKVGMNMKVVITLAVILVFSVALRAGEIQGQVLNAQGIAVAGAKITIAAANQQEGAHWEAETKADGTYTIGGIGSGSYLVTVAAPSGGQILRREVSVPGGAEVAHADFQFPAASSPGVSAAEELNPNVFIYRIDLNDLRNRLNVGRGPDPTYVAEFSADQDYFGAEFGAPLFAFQPLRPRALASQWRATLYALHQNSALNARNFFNVGPLRASRTTNYSVTGGGPLFSPKVSLLLDVGQNFTSGFVNGNIQDPRADERVPNPAAPSGVQAVIASLLKAYPAELPNLGDPATSHRLNSNAQRDIKAKNGLARLDFKPTEQTSWATRYSINDYAEDPFQLVAGQNPQTDLRAQSAYVSLTRVFSPQTLGLFGFHYDRATASLKPTRRFTDLFAGLPLTAVPDVSFSSDTFNDLGPGTQFPRLRVQNRFQPYLDFSHTRGSHTLKFGWSSTRVQVNDLQSDNSRGTLNFARDFGRSEVENFLLGTPSSLTIAVGNLYRGFRNWEHSLYFSDEFRLKPTLMLSLGLRYELITAPTEVNHLTEVGYPTDKNNFAPRFGFAWNPGGGKTTLRGSYGISYGALFPVTYGMTRFNSPATQTIQVVEDPLLKLLEGFSPQPTAGGQSTVWRLSPDLVLPYSHQYTFGIEHALPGAITARVAYIGMRTFHLLTHQIYNRAAPFSPEECARERQTDPNLRCNSTQDINYRRPDQRFYDINVIESNSIAYYDALQLAVDKKVGHGLTFRATYTFGKNIDLGGDFTNTASGVDKPPEDGTPTCEICNHFADMKGLSLFDTTNVFILSYSYNLPFSSATTGWLSTLLRGWQVSGTTIFQSGTPFHPHTGSDGPGFGNVDGAGHDRPNILDPSILGMSIDNPDTSQCLFGVPTDTCPNVAPKFNTILPLGGRGNVGMNVFRKDGTSNWNVAFGRTFRLPGTRERSLQFRSEFINLFNNPQFAKPGVQIAGDTFGEITNTANKGRQVQFSLRMNF